MPNDQPRHHHYLPQFYLSGFTQSGRRKDLLWVFDKEKLEYRKTKPIKVAHERDYFRLKGENADPHIVERMFGEFEGTVAPVLRNIRENWVLPGPQEMANLLGFIAILYVRIPKMRDWIRKAHMEMSDLFVEISLADRNRWEAEVEELRRTRKDIPGGIGYDQVKEAWDNKRIRSAPNHNLEIMRIIDLGQHGTPFFLARKWTMFIAHDLGPHFITGDAPVVPIWNAPQPPGTPVGLALNALDLYFPISPRVALLGTWEKPSRVLQASEEFVLSANSNVIGWSNRFIFSHSNDARCWIDDNTQGMVRELVLRIRKGHNSH
jgi:hypothetical protein